MHITRIEAWPVHLKCEPYTIAYETVESTTNVFVRLHTNGPLVGYGVAAPDLPVTGETPEDVLTALGQAEAILKGQGVERPAQLYRGLRDGLGWKPSTLAALDMAVLDLHSQIADMPLWKLLGGARDRILTSVTIGILDEKSTIEETQRWLARGFRSIKLKGGLNVQSDITRVHKVRETIGPDVELSFDANQGYSVSDALTFVRACDTAGLAYVEQPTPRKSVSDLVAVQRDSQIPIMADESLKTPQDAHELAGRIPLFNVKLQKVGGIQAALMIDALAIAWGVTLMVGCLDECALSVAAGLHFALGRPSVCFADLDSHFTLLDDPTAGAVVFRDGYLYPGERRGLSPPG
jgi:L-alanine-DL-glutamate epimerase-like enolase superfamily enzyme